MDNSEVRLAKIEQRVDNLEKEAQNFNKIIEPLKENYIRNDEHYQQIMAILTELKEDVKELKNRPSKFLDYIYMTVIATVIGFLFSHFS